MLRKTPMADRVGLGIIGFGDWPRQAYVPALRALSDEVDVAAVSARSEKTLAAGGEAFGGDPARYHNYHDLLADDRVQAVMIAVPNALHHEVASWALRAGKHVLLEAPFGEYPDQAFALLDEADEILADRSDLVLQADLELGYAPCVHRLKALVSEGVIGRPRSIVVRLWCDWGLGGAAETVDSKRCGFYVWTGPWYLHLLDLLTERLPQEADTTGTWVMNGPVMDHGWTSLIYDGDLIARFEYSLIAPAGQRIEVEVAGERGEAHLDLMSGTIRRRAAGESDWHSESVPAAEPVAAFPGMRECVASFVQAIRDGGPVLANREACRRIHQVCFAAQQSADEGRAVEVGSSS